MTNTTYTDCRSNTGITIGIIDAIITLCRLLQGRDIDAPEIAEALKDIGNDEDFSRLLHHIRNTVQNDISPE